MASVDFDNTAGFMGFAAWADAAMTQPITSGVTISSDAGFNYDLITVPEPRSLVWLAALGLLLAARRR